MYLSEAITARAATDTGARDPDSLLGCLIWTEAGGTEKNLAKLINPGLRLNNADRCNVALVKDLERVLRRLREKSLRI